MEDIKAPRKERTLRNAESIAKGALSLTLQERVNLTYALQESIKAEVETIKAAAAQAEKIANGSN